MGRFNLSKVIKIGGRSSLLSKIQILNVKKRLLELFPDLVLETTFRESSGDKDQTTPLWQMPNTGVFTNDLKEDLLQNKLDVVIHSWKDLDLRDRTDTVLVSVLPREDVRDVLLFKKSKWLNPAEEFTILTSSPRREYHLGQFIKTYFPHPINRSKIQIESVRGNVQTRLRKYLHSEAGGILIAKAALDRILSYQGETDEIPEWKETVNFIRETFGMSLFMVLPQSIFPNAPAQGALCAEVKKDDQQIINILKNLTDPDAEDTCLEERKILSEYGGGCHQKIGVSVLKRKYGTVTFVSGLTESGITIQKKLISPSTNLMFNASEVWPPFAKMAARQRERLTYMIPSKVDILVSKGYAFPLDLSVNPTSQTLWSAGLTTWAELAKRGFWVNGSCDGLGEAEPINIKHLLGRKENFVKLTHTEADTSNSHFPVVPTYYVSAPEIPTPFDPTKIKAAYWRSGSEFEIVTKRFPELLKVIHFVGPGSTYTKIKQTLGEDSKNKVFVTLSFEEWKSKYITQNG